MAKKALGKGLSALISQKAQQKPASQVPPNSDRVIQTNPEEILPSPFQPRRRFDEQQISELADSIRESGLIQPLVVRIVDGRYELIAGERRLRAVKSLGHTTVSVVVREATDQEVAELTLIENLQREDLTPLEEAEQYQVLQQRFNMKQETIAQHVGKSRAAVANMIRLLELEQGVKDMLEASPITIGHAKVLLQLKDPEQQVNAARKVVRNTLTVRQTEQLVRELLNPEPKPEPKPSTLPEAYQSICNDLSREFGTRVNITLKGKSNGVIEIPYTGREDLERILQLCGISSRF